MLTRSSLKIRLLALSGSEISALAEASGVSEPGIYKIRSGETADPRGGTIEALSLVLLAMPEGSEGQPIPLDRAMQIERLTNGAVTREELRPDVDWRTHADVASDTDPNEAAEPLEKAA